MTFTAAKFLKTIRQQLLILAVVAIVMLAAYVSIGRQFMPAVSRYVDYFEEQISLVAGVPVSIDSLSGSFAGFNPVLTIEGLSLLLAGEPQTASGDAAGAVYFSSATVILDIPQSIWRRQWVLADFTIENLDINLEQTPNGNWQLKGVSMEGGDSVDLASIYDALLRISRLDLANVNVNVDFLEGTPYQFSKGSVSIRNQNATHYIHASAFPASSRAEIELSLEVFGTDFNEMTGQFYADVPVGNYSSLLAAHYGEEFELLEVLGGAELWLSFQQGQPQNLVLQPQVSRLVFKGKHSDGTALQQVNGTAFVEFSDARPSTVAGVSLADMHVSWNGVNWLNFNSKITLDENHRVRTIFDSINIDLLAGVTLESGFLPADMSDVIDAYDPKGFLENLEINALLADGNLENLRLSTNIRAAKASAVRGSPNLSGMNGYAELQFDPAAGIVSGMGEIDSDNFSMNIPNVFTATWDYSYANGALDFLIDLNEGQTVNLVSSVIVAESDAVDAHAQFATALRRYPDGRRESELELYVGTSRMDGRQKALYLPDGPNASESLKNSMAWVDNALISGEVDNAGIVYRGSTLPGAASALKTFQSYFELKQGNLNFSDEWPMVNELSALVHTSDNDVDVDVESGRSLGLTLNGASGTIRRNDAGENWISISGEASGETSSGLNYIQNAGLAENIKSAFASWQAEGEFTSDVQVAIPLSQPEEEIRVRLELQMQENALYLPEYALNVEDLSGPVIFDTETGVEPTALRGSLFGNSVDFSLSSEVLDGAIQTIQLGADGIASPEELIEWPMQSDFVVSLLNETQGEFEYTAKLNLDQVSGAQKSNSLEVQTTLLGLEVALPEPYGKSRETAMPLALNIDFGESQTVTGSYNDSLAFQLRTGTAGIDRGVVYLGSELANLENLVVNNQQGLVVLGELDVLHLEQWINFLDTFGNGGESADEFSETLAFVDIHLGDFELYDQLLPDVQMRIEPSPENAAWTVRMVGENILGQVDIPYSEDDYLLVDLEYLRLPSDEPPASVEVNSQQIESVLGPSEPPEDPLLDIDPRQLAKMKFMTDDFSIGARPYGSWNFTLDPIETGAELTDLSFDFRGLRLGLDEENGGNEESEEAVVDESSQPNLLKPHFLWSYDGVEHQSELQGQLSADNMADVLTANGLAAVFESTRASFETDIQWPGSPAAFAAAGLSGSLKVDIEDGRFLQDASGNGALKLISIINFDAIMRRLRFSDDLLRRGLAYDEITADFALTDGQVEIKDRLVISGPSSLYQVTGDLDLEKETIAGELYVTLPVSRNIPWIGLLTANIPLAVGAYLFDRIFGDQVNSLTSAVYTLEGPWEGLEPEFKQAFGSPATPTPN
ncbi:MAG: YhdP family protein [Pseudohongiellaceae bacterium]